jgi:immune inhibitor A
MVRSLRAALAAASVIVLGACGISTSVAPVVTPANTVVVGPSTCPAWQTPALGNPIPPPTDGSQAAQAQYMAQVVLRTPRPLRNLYWLTQHVSKHLAAPIFCLARTAPRQEQVGHEATFWVTNPDQNGYHQVRARLVYVTAHLYMYVVDGASYSLTGLRRSADLFERQSFATDEATFGPHWSPGVDADSHITVLNGTNLGNLGGYFSSEDEYPQAVFKYSNERQLIVANMDGGAVPGEPYYDSTLAHEFQHMIHWYWHPADPSWVNEGMSMLAQHLNHFISGGVDTEFLEVPNARLGGWTDNTAEMGTHYGIAMLFNDYFAEHYGGYSVLRELVTDPAQVPLNYDHVLAAHGFRDRFDDVYAKFVIANLLNDPGVAGGIYAYPTLPNERATTQYLVTHYPYPYDGSTVPNNLDQYATRYYEFQPTAGVSSLHLQFSGSPYVGVVDNTPAAGATAEWWSNSANNMQSSLTRDVDLSALAGKPATLTFKAWYDLEPNFDYTYVEASTDGGQNWTTLPATTSTKTDPNGANLGNGMTSPMLSKAGCSLTSDWHDEQVDLSAYAGKAIKLRFQTVTDDTVHCQGFALDDIRIPEIAYADNVSSDNGWQADGYIRTQNVLPEQYVLQAVLFPHGGGTPVVRQIPVDARTGTGSATLTGFGALDHVTLAITALAPTTVVPAQYLLEAQAS